MNKYIVLDIESPNTYFSSISAIGIIIIENNEIKDKIYTLINPEEEFEEEIISLTNITPEMVKDKPTFKEFWPKIEELLVTNIIVGHNVTYDLTVISNSLQHYNIDVPSFKYVCTLKSAYQRLKLDSYALTSIMDTLNVDYDAHNALADAEVTYFLLNYLNNIKEINILDQKVFSKNALNKSVEEFLYPNINELYGMLLEFKYKENVTENNLNIFTRWIDENMEYSHYSKMNNIILQLRLFTSKNDITKEDKINISTIVTGIHNSEKYSKKELNYHILNGILKMLESDEEITQKEFEFIKKWLSYYDLPDDIDKEVVLNKITFI